MRCAGTPICFATRYLVSPIGIMNSWSKSSPGVTGDSRLLRLRLVVVDDFNVMGACRSPVETETILVVDAYAVLPHPVTTQRVQLVPWWDPQILKSPSDLKLTQLASCHGHDVCKPSDRQAGRQRRGGLITERMNHENINATRY